ncbi:MAG: carbamoyl-phosphate synthase large subunit [Phycisphaerales bacterium]|nr:MAG: carbamoyl-phosphate synthase large subunit [Phycisphaerales bacterium]
MPKRTDIKTILVLGSGPIVIGQGCEFDYSGTQACKTLKHEGYRIVLVNSNPATIMTDPQFSDRTYIEPITPEAVRKIIEKEQSLGPRIDAILPTLGGQTALNCACALYDNGTLKEFGIEMIGANREVIHRAEDRQAFKDICEGIGLKLPRAKTVKTLADAEAFLEEIGLPAIIRPAFTLGGSGGGIAYNREEFKDIVSRGLAASMIQQVQIDQSVIGWKEFELEVVRDRNDNCIIVCGIENIDPMGVHTGDSITVAPILTLTDKEYQAMRDAAFAVMRAVGVETGGSNVQFAVNPNPTPGPDGKKPFEMVVVEMNPRVSRSSALASKATGFPIAKIAARLAVGYTLDELKNDITGTTSACFEPTIDYVVTKMPRWTFEKFPEADETLTTQMKSVGEAMAIGRTFKESLQKVIRSMDVKRYGLGLDRNDKWLEAMRAVEEGQLVLDVMGNPAPSGGPNLRGGSQSSPSSTGLRTADGQPLEWPVSHETLVRKLAVPSQGRLYYIRYAMKMGWSVEKIHEFTRIDPFFLDQIQELVQFEDELCDYRTLQDVPKEVLFRAKELGYSDAQLANLYLEKLNPESILQVREHRKSLGITPVYKLVDTCAAEFEAKTPYYYSTYERGSWRDGKETPPADEVRLTDRPKVVILGGGPNRVGQGIEFDYCCCHAAFAARDLGFESVMINANPETVSTDYDTSDLLFFEPLTLEDVQNIVDRLSGASDAIEFLDNLNLKNLLKDTFPELNAEQVQLAARAALIQQDIRCALCIDACVLHREESVPDLVVLSASDESGNEIVLEYSPSSKSWRIQRHEHSWAADYPPGFVGSVRPKVESWINSRKNTLVRGLIVQFGGQTPLNLAKGLVAAGAPIIGTSVDSIDRAEDRERFDEVLEKLNLRRPPAGIAHSIDEAANVAGEIGYPILIRPSYVLGGRGMEICSDERSLRNFMATALETSGLDDAPVLIDKFLDGAIEVDVDVVADFDESRPGEHVAMVCGIMEQIEQAGVHSGDSACTLPPASLSPDITRRIETLAKGLARELKVCGLMNIQLAVKDGEIFILEVNPRASRTVPFVSKATHTPWPALAAKAMMGRSLTSLGAKEKPIRGYHAVKESVFPFNKFPGVDVVLGPEMRSTGEVMGIDRSLPIAYAKSQQAAGNELPTSPDDGGVFVSVREADRDRVVEPIRKLMKAGYKVFATEGTANHLKEHGLEPTTLQKIGTGARPNVLDMMSNGEIALVVNTPTRTGWKTDEGRIRSTAVKLNIPMITTATAAHAAAQAMDALREGVWGVAALQDYERLNTLHPVTKPFDAALKPSTPVESPRR